MATRWLEISLAVPDETVDIVSQMLVELGSTGVTTAEHALDTFIIPSPDDLGNSPEIKAYFEQHESPESLCEKIREKLMTVVDIYPALAEVRVSGHSLEGQDWANEWKQHFPPFRVGDRLVICPSWTDWQKEAAETVLTLDPGQAFGTGTHATTSLCLDAVAEHFASSTPPQRVLDVGTGSGILAMAAAALGAEQVLANDIDQTACDVAQANVNGNHLDQHITVTNSPLEELAGTYDLVLANILAGENLRLANELVKHLQPGGRLVLSGILIEQEQQVLDGFARQPLSLLKTSHRDEWTCIVYQRHE